MKKKIAILISGNIRIFEQNKNFINKILSKFECFYFAAIWKNQKNSANLKLLYHPIQIQEINRNNWDALVKKIKYVTGEENRSYKISNVLNMWDSIQKTTDFFYKYCKKFDLNFDYILRYRTDLKLLSYKDFSKQLLNLNNNEILIPECHNYRGVNDQFFFMNFKTFIILKGIISFIILCIKNKRVFHSEYLFSQFIKSNSIKIKIIDDINYAQLGSKTHKNLSLKPTKTPFIPFNDKIEMKIIKYLLKFKKFQKKITNVLY